MEWYGDWELLREFLASFQIPGSDQTIDSISHVITAKDIAKDFKSWKETTTMRPSGRHLGNFKVLLRDTTTLLECFRKFLNTAQYHEVSLSQNGAL